MAIESGQDWMRQQVSDLRRDVSAGYHRRVSVVVARGRFRRELEKWPLVSKDGIDDAEQYATDIRNAMGNPERTEQAIDGLAQLFDL